MWWCIACSLFQCKLNHAKYNQQMYLQLHSLFPSSFPSILPCILTPIKIIPTSSCMPKDGRTVGMFEMRTFCEFSGDAHSDCPSVRMPIPDGHFFFPHLNQSLQLPMRGYSGAQKWVGPQGVI